MGDGLIAEGFVERDACGVGVSDAGAEVAHILRSQAFFQGLVQIFADPPAAGLLFHIDGGLNRPVVGGPALKS